MDTFCRLTHRIRQSAHLGLIATLCGLFAGCSTTVDYVKNRVLPEPPAPATEPTNFYIEPSDVAPIRRIALMPVYSPDTNHQTQAILDQAFFNKLSETQLFEVVMITREDLARRFSARAFNSAAPITDTLFNYIEEATYADAVVFFDVTSYRPYKPVKLGIRSKMLRLEDRKIIWAIDQSFDTGDQRVAEEALDYQSEIRANPTPTHQPDRILISPSVFIYFAAERSVQTLKTS